MRELGRNKSLWTARKSNDPTKFQQIHKNSGEQKHQVYTTHLLIEIDQKSTKVSYKTLALHLFPTRHLQEPKVYPKGQHGITKVTVFSQRKSRFAITRDVFGDFRGPTRKQGTNTASGLLEEQGPSGT